ncbi:secreted protein containing molecular chaperone IbpA, HSP20 family [Candidatus Velamenicoccus archaeovorus]|uniref:Secreted protein containing molecular chaperone IbpA, HSP20 family n=1 Tax=Velamenicoccus archaeovorus TaxID=1930593 RepID=A0A410P5N1_VELA1|nr:Hsp20 family protein [Candidatus Velamenicoccus archaeovorus]QAT17391.1 secreted protein containing molecular chaperone IbpA, HSP20 family [Candidatus Velamenicoccus archaeovorus]
MKNKIILGAVIVLAAAFLLENAYLMGRHSGEKAQQKNVVVQYQPFPMPSSLENNPAFMMDMRAREPFDEMNRMQEIMRERMQRMQDTGFYSGPEQKDFLNLPAPAASGQSFRDKNKAYIINISMPGFEKKDIHVRTEGRQLIVSGETAKGGTEKGRNFYAQESRSGNFTSTFLLPQDARINQMTTEYKDGILTITIPKNKASSPRR